MSNKGPLPDAWDDDWENQISEPVVAPEQPQATKKLSKAERRAQHAEFNRQLWETAEKPPEPMIFLQARDNVPLQPSFKPGVTLLSRKPPAPQVLSRNGATTGMAGLKLDDDDDSEEERRKQNEAAFEERKTRAAKERTEKERRYAEARERLFGSPAPAEDPQGRASPSKQHRGKGRGRGGRDTQPRSTPGSNEQSPARSAASAKQLYDPSYSVKPNSIFIQKRESSNSRPSTPNEQQRPIREPKGPEAIGRGGRGFAPRGRGSGPAV
ncbi:hypothetical protein BDV96DRAFT_641255 [Lophiotrema nucula]|uniref:SUZ domain-containing protein n=1 Tax=Lophiotrema nucula TaxID=690887 RepID=A0A6A5ZMG4_9PLEO|nr:hypothetical protein BDV96DRAFT_641255 [Lophiotrema nucula]